MPSLPVLATVVRELLTTKQVPRICEPELIMEDPESVTAYIDAGREIGVMAPVYLFHTIKVCEVIRPGDVVLDLACGPATQLAQIARLNPDVRFVGVDMSVPMLERARAHLADLQLDNVELVCGRIDDLTRWGDRSVNAVMSTMALHHLPDRQALRRTFAEAGRVLALGGGVYMADFGRLRSERSMRYFATQYADRQPQVFTRDYFNSLRAAFALEDFREASASLRCHVRVLSTVLTPFMVAVASNPRREPPPHLRRALQRLLDALEPHQERDFQDLRSFFRWGGLALSV